MFESFNVKKVKDFFAGKKTGVIVAVCLLGIALIFLSEFLPRKSERTGVAVVSEADYTETMEKKLTSVIGKLSGVSDVEVVITLERGYESVYATEPSSKSVWSGDGEAGESILIIRNSDGSESPVTIRQIDPVVRGVVVVCKGGGDALNKQNILQSVTTLLGVAANRVCIIGK